MEARAIKQMTLEQPEHLNPDLLREELQAALGDKFVSLDTGRGLVQKEDVEAALANLGTERTTLLREELQAILDAVNGGKAVTAVVVRATADATDEDAQKIKDILAEHDATKMSQLQQKEAAKVEAKERLKGLDMRRLIQGEKSDRLAIQILADTLQDLVDTLNDR